MNDLILEKYKEELMSVGVTKEDLDFWISILDIYIPQLENEISNLKNLYNNLMSMNRYILNELYRCYWFETNRKNSFVYFIYNKETKLIKIGCTENPIKRLKQLNSMFLNHFGVKDALELLSLCYVPDGSMRKAEKDFHEEFSEYRVHGEWFSIPNKELKNYFDTIFRCYINKNKSLYFDYDLYYLCENIKLNIKTPSEYDFAYYALNQVKLNIQKDNNIDKDLYNLITSTLNKYIENKIELDKNVLFQKVFYCNNETLNFICYLLNNNVSLSACYIEKDYTPKTHTITINDKDYKNVKSYSNDVEVYINNYMDVLVKELYDIINPEC